MAAASTRSSGDRNQPTNQPTGPISDLLDSLAPAAAHGNSSQTVAPPEPQAHDSAEPSSSPLGSAIRRHWLLVLICGVTLAVLGTAVGATRTTTFTAASTLQVGKVNPNSPGFYGFVQSASQLATMFSRAITAGPVLHRIQARLGVSPRAAASRLSAEPIPNSPAFRVIATGPSADAAIQLANVTAGSVIAYEARSNAYDSDTARLFRQYRAASLKQAKATTAVKQAQREYGRFPTAEQRAALDRAEARRADASLEAQALSASYQLSAQSTTRGLISLLAGASGASSDRGSKIQLLGFVGLLGGLLLGCALAQVAERRSRWTRHWLLHPYAARPGR